jgi:hypothetical protein
VITPPCIRPWVALVVMATSEASQNLRLPLRVGCLVVGHLDAGNILHAADKAMVAVGLFVHGQIRFTTKALSHKESRLLLRLTGETRFLKGQNGIYQKKTWFLAK